MTDKRKSANKRSPQTLPASASKSQEPLTEKEAALLVTLEDEIGLSKEWMISWCGEDFYKTILNLRKRGFGINCQTVKGEWRYALKSWPKGVTW